MCNNNWKKFYIIQTWCKQPSQTWVFWAHLTLCLVCTPWLGGNECWFCYQNFFCILGRWGPSALGSVLHLLCLKTHLNAWYVCSTPSSLSASKKAHGGQHWCYRQLPIFSSSFWWLLGLLIFSATLSSLSWLLASCRMLFLLFCRVAHFFLIVNGDRDESGIAAVIILGDFFPNSIQIYLTRYLHTKEMARCRVNSKLLLRNVMNELIFRDATQNSPLNFFSLTIRLTR